MHYPSALETLEGCAWYILKFIHIFLHLKLTQMLLEVVWNTQLKFR